MLRGYGSVFILEFAFFLQLRIEIDHKDDSAKNDSTAQRNAKTKAEGGIVIGKADFMHTLCKLYTQHDIANQRNLGRLTVHADMPVFAVLRDRGVKKTVAVTVNGAGHLRGGKLRQFQRRGFQNVVA